MKQEGHDDVLVLEGLYKELCEEFDRVDVGNLEYCYLSARISRKLDHVKSLELGDRRPYINLVLPDLIEMEDELAKSNNHRNTNPETAAIKSTGSEKM